MEMMAEAGLPPAQILHSATGAAAKALRLDDRTGIGTLIVGSWADFVVLDRDPRQDIRNTKSIASVWIAGNQVRR
jgi:imidazolonepropionase-like amidohydrolase